MTTPSSDLLSDRIVGKATDIVATFVVATAFAVFASLTIDVLLMSVGLARHFMALGISLWLIGLYPARHVGPSLVARYDNKAMRASLPLESGFLWAGPRDEIQQRTWDAALRWCRDDAGEEARSWWQRCVTPDPAAKFAVAVLMGASGTGKSHLAEAWYRELDGSELLDACTTKLQRIALKLRFKVRDCLFWKSPGIGSAWDAGYLLEDPAARTHLAAFSPRRMTLMIADELSPQSLAQYIEVLAARRRAFRYRVRLLVISTALPSPLNRESCDDRHVWTAHVKELGEIPVWDMSAGQRV